MTRRRLGPASMSASRRSVPSRPHAPIWISRGPTQRPRSSSDLHCSPHTALACPWADLSGGAAGRHRAPQPSFETEPRTCSVSFRYLALKSTDRTDRAAGLAASPIYRISPSRSGAPCVAAVCVSILRLDPSAMYRRRRPETIRLKELEACRSGPCPRPVLRLRLAPRSCLC